MRYNKARGEGMVEGARGKQDTCVIVLLPSRTAASWSSTCAFATADEAQRSRATSIKQETDSDSFCFSAVAEAIGTL